MRKNRIFAGIAIGFAAALLLMFVVYRIFRKGGDEKVQNDYYIITNQIQKMNKMVTVEQDLSSMQRTKISREFLGGMVPGTSKSIITFTKTNVQVSYDLTRMKIDVDSVNHKLILQELPQPQVRIIPSVEIQSMDDSFIDRFDESDIKRITKTAKDKAYQSVDQQKLVAESKKQLRENLNQIFVLAKALNYTIEDKTGQLAPSEL